jgi:hypothetical protein
MSSEIAHAWDLVFRGRAPRLRKVSWTDISIYVTASLNFNTAPIGGIQGGLDAVYDPEWPGGLVAINGASSSPFAENPSDIQGFTDNSTNLAFIDWGPGSEVGYGAFVTIDNVDTGLGGLATGFTLDGYGAGWCGVQISPNFNSGSWPLGYIWQTSGFCEVV